MLALLILELGPANALAGPLLDPTPAPAASGKQFDTRVLTNARPGDPRDVQDVGGRIIDRAGRGVDGVAVRVVWDGGQFFTQSAGGGYFKFTLTRGRFRIELMNATADPAPFDLDGKTEVTVEFVERALALATATAGPAQTTPTPTATRTPTPPATSTPFRTPLPSAGTPIVVLTATAPQLPPTPTATPTGGLPGLGRLGLGNLDLGVQINAGNLVQTFLLGIAVAAGLTVFGLLILALRR